MHNFRAPLTARLPLLLVLGVFVAYALLYAWATPPLEASDELWHIGVIQHIAETGALPVQVVGVETPYEQEGSQPPLYYLIAAALVKPIDRSDFEALRQPNPHAVAGVPGNIGNKNLILHDSPHPPLTGTTLAVYVARLFSIVLGCVTVWAVYESTRVLVQATSNASHPSAVPLLAAGLTAFNPMFLFITASANNDNLVTALNSLLIWQTLVLLQDGSTLRRSSLIAVFVALASLSKLSGLVLVPVVALAALWVAYRQRDWRGLVTLGVLMAGICALLAGWWYLRNIQLYGELFGTHTMALVAGARTEPFTLATLLNEFQGFRFGYWGVFGAFNIMTFRWFYDVMDAVTVIALIGLALALWSLRRNREALMRVLLLGLIVVIGAVAVIAWTAQTYASQGRLLFPYVAAITPLLALGLLKWLEPRPNISLPLAQIGIALLAGFALVVPFASIAPQYKPPLDKLPETAHPVYARFGDVELIGYETPERRYLPGDSVPITVYWQVRQPSARDLSLYLHAVLTDGRVIGKVDSYPGGGTLRTTTWQTGAIYADTYAIPLNNDASGSSKLRIQVGWRHDTSNEHVPPTLADGQALEVVMLDAGGFGDGQNTPLPDALTPVKDVRFGGTIALMGYQLADDQLTLYWNTLTSPTADYTVFVQVLDAANTVVGQGDAPPDLPTRFWLPGERYSTRHTLVYPEALAPGQYRLVIGWYNPADNTRLDTDAPDEAVTLETLTVP